VVGTTLSLIGLTFAGVRFPWNSVQALAPLIIGLALIGAFILYEAKIPAEPTIPWEILANRATLPGYASTLLHGVTSISLIYYLPVYFQASLGSGPIRSGVQSLPTSFVISLMAIIGGLLVQILHKYRPSNAVGWIMAVVGFGLLSLMRADSSEAQWVGYQILAAGGTGVIYTAAVFPILAPLPVQRTASALAFFVFLRSFGNTWGVTISGTILQNELKKTLPAAFVSQFPSGTEIAYAAIPVIRTLPEPLKAQIQAAFADSLKVVWQTMIGVSGLGIISVLLLKEVPMRRFTDETFGLSDSDKRARTLTDEKDPRKVAANEAALSAGRPASGLALQV